MFELGYSSLEMGNSSASSVKYVDYIQIFDGEHIPTDTEIDISYTPSWGVDTLFLANFNHNLNAGNITTSSPITKWTIYKQDKNATSLKFICTVDSSKSNIIDYISPSNGEFRYVVFPETDSILCSPINSEYINPVWSNLVMYDILESSTQNIYYADTYNMWSFNGNISTDAMKQNIDKTIYSGLSRYPKVSVGKRNYINGSVSCSLGSVKQVDGLSSYINDNAELTNKFMDFVINGNKKILSDRKGNVLLVDIDKFSNKYDDRIYCQPTTISFDYTEIGSTDNISVINRA